MSNRDIWIDIYVKNNLGDSPDCHAAFAKALGVSRHEAKVECYKIMYTSDFFKNMLNSLNNG